MRSATGKSLCIRVALAVFSPLLGILAGCAAPGTIAPSREYVLALRYDPTRTAFETGADPTGGFHAAFRSIRSRGFNAVVMDSLPDAPGEILDAAREHQLRAYVMTRDVHYYLLTGKLPREGILDRFVQAEFREMKSHPSFAGVAILGGYRRDHVLMLVAALDSSGIDYLVAGQSQYGTDRGQGVAWLDAARAEIQNVSQVERLMVEFHGEVQAGWNDGLVINPAPYELAAEEVSPPVVVAENLTFRESDSVEAYPLESRRSRRFATDNLVRRALAWGPRLSGCAREPLPKSETGNPSLTTTIFRKGERRYLFLFNQSSEPVRGVVRFHTNLPGGKVARAVEVPADASQIAGRVFPARSGEFAVQPELRAGDAILYELF